MVAITLPDANPRWITSSSTPQLRSIPSYSEPKPYTTVSHNTTSTNQLQAKTLTTSKRNRLCPKNGMVIKLTGPLSMLLNNDQNKIRFEPKKGNPYSSRQASPVHGRSTYLDVKVQRKLVDYVCMYFFEYKKKYKIRYLFNEIFQKSAFPAVFGCIHLILYDRPGTQLLALGSVQICLIATRIYFVCKRSAYVVFRTWVNNFGSLLRIIFQLNFYVYYKCTSLIAPINQFSRILLISYLGNWALEMILELLFNGVKMVKIIHKRCQKAQKVVKEEHIKENINLLFKKKERVQNDETLKKRESNNLVKKSIKIKLMAIRNSINARQLRIKNAYPKSKF